MSAEKGMMSSKGSGRSLGNSLRPAWQRTAPWLSIVLLGALGLCAIHELRADEEQAGAPNSLETPLAPTPDATSKNAASQGKEKSESLVLFDGQSLEKWRIIDQWDFKDHGAVEVEDGTIVLHKGNPATGISWKDDLPRSNYEFTWKAQRREGSDFFCGLTFPVQDSYCTLILGGWGGQIVGLSNIDGFSAVENATTQVVAFERNRWYQFRLRVTDQKIQIWMDDRSLIEVMTQGRKFSIWWEQEPVTPLGIVTWNTTGALRELQWKQLAE